MSLDNLIGCKFSFGVSDPFEFSAEVAEGPFVASAVACFQHLLLLELPEPLEYKGTRFKYLVATARHEDARLDQVSRTVGVAVNLSPVPGNNIRHLDDCFSAAGAWRGWHLIGGLRVAPNEPVHTADKGER